MALISATTPEETAAVIARTGVSPTQTDEARAKLFDQLTLVEKLNRFREKFVAHMQHEVIFNPNHILEGLRQNDLIWDEVDDSRIADPNHDKRRVIFSQFVGWTQRTSVEPVKQNIRQGMWYLIEQNESRARQSYLNRAVRNDYSDGTLMSSSIVDGVGYKFALGRIVSCAAGVRGAACKPLAHFSKLVWSKKCKLSELVTQLARACARKSERRCIVM